MMLTLNLTKLRSFVLKAVQFGAGLTVGIAGLLTTNAMAQEHSSAASASAPEVPQRLNPKPAIASGNSTKAWLAAQGSRQDASETRQTLSGPVLSKVHERYVKSFTMPVPERLSKDTK